MRSTPTASARCAPSSTPRHPATAATAGGPHHRRPRPAATNTAQPAGTLIENRRNGQGCVRELEPHDDQRRDDPVHERQPMIGFSALSTQPFLATTSFPQRRLLPRQPRISQFLDQGTQMFPGIPVRTGWDRAARLMIVTNHASCRPATTLPVRTSNPRPDAPRDHELAHHQNCDLQVQRRITRPSGPPSARPCDAVVTVRLLAS